MKFAAQAPLVTIDARMLRSSGIGTYLSALLPRVIERATGVRFCLLGSGAELEGETWTREPRVACRRLSAGVYSALEQPLLLARTPRETRVFWAPHVNVPVVGPGRLLVTVHDVLYANPPRESRPRIDKALYLRFVMRALRRRAQAVICVSDFTRRELERLFGPFACPLHTVHSAVEPAWTNGSSGERPHARPYLLFVGNLKPHKNVARTLEAFASIVERVPHDFVLVGGGDAASLESRLEARVRPRVTFVSPLRREQLRGYVAHAAGLVLASLYEGFGLPPLEAMALGVPVLVSRAASLPEVCGDAALYCDPESVEDIARGLERLLLDGVERERLVRSGSLRVREFDWEKTADRTVQVLESLL